MYGKCAPCGTIASFSGSFIYAHTTKKSLAPAPREPHLLEGKAVMASKTKYLGFNTMEQPVIVTHSNTGTTTHLQETHQHARTNTHTAVQVRPNEHDIFCTTRVLTLFDGLIGRNK